MGAVPSTVSYTHLDVYKRQVLQHILKVDQVAVVHVLGKVIRIVEMDQALIMGIHDLLRQQHTLCLLYTSRCV